MESEEKKINKFRQFVLQDAQNERDKIMQKYTAEKRVKIEAAENEILQQIYADIQKMRADITRRSGEKIAETASENRRRLIGKRDGITASVFGELLAKIEDFRKTDGYKNYLFKTVADAIEAVGSGSCTVYIDPADAAFADEITAKFGAETKTDKIIGGCRVVNNDKGVICSNTTAQRINELKDGFFESAGLVI